MGLSRIYLVDEIHILDVDFSRKKSINERRSLAFSDPGFEPGLGSFLYEKTAMDKNDL
jgi:hypothetical protein